MSNGGKRNGDGAPPGESELRDRMLPHDLEAERMVIGGCLLQPSVIDDAQMLLQPACFYGESHQSIYSAVLDLHNKGKQVDAVLVARELERRKQLEDCGGPALLARCLDAVPHAAYTAHYAEIVRGHWIRRQVIDAWKSATEHAFDLSFPVEDILTIHDTETQKLLETGVQTADVLDLGEIVTEALRRNPSDRMGIATGFPALDEMTGGLRGGALYTVAARPSVGKTSFALSLLRYVSERHPALFVTLEMARLDIGERLLSMESGVSMHALLTGRLTDEDHAKLLDCREPLSALRLMIDDRGDQTVGRIGTAARLFKRKRGVKLVVVDYLQLISPDDSKDNRERQVARMSWGLKVLAKSLDIPVVILAQLNREIEKRPDKRPKLSDLRESGAVEQDSDQVWFLHRPDTYDPEDRPGEADLIVSKNRNGPTGCVPLRYDRPTMTFRAKDEFDDPQIRALDAAW